MNARTRFSFALLLVAGFATGCTNGQFSTSSFRRQLGNLFVPPPVEYPLGQRISQRVEQRQPLLRDANIQAYVQQVGGRVAQYAAMDRPDVRFEFKVLDKPDTVNAFAVPGGHIYVFSGLLLAAENESELAGVLAHETGHIVGRHSANQMAARYGIEMLYQIAVGEQPQQIVQIATQFAARGAMSKFSRDDEREADQYGVKYMTEAGYDPRGMVSFFRKLLAMRKQSPTVVETVLATHPTTEERIRNIEAQIAWAGNPRGEIGRERFLQRTASLRRSR